jgi:ornithine carbamoyltransferase
MIFEKASTRTRLSFEAGMQQLGGLGDLPQQRDSQLQRGESVEDAAQVISRMSDVVMIRTFEQAIGSSALRPFARAGHQWPDQRVPPLPDSG